MLLIDFIIELMNDLFFDSNLKPKFLNNLSNDIEPLSTLEFEF